MSKVRNFAEIAPNIGFSEFDFYDLYRSTFEKSELGRMKRLLPLHEMAESFGLTCKSMKPKLGRRSYFTPEGKVALMFLKMYTQMSSPETAGAAGREHPLPDVLRCDDRSDPSIDELQAAG